MTKLNILIAFVAVIYPALFFILKYIGETRRRLIKLEKIIAELGRSGDSAP